MRSAIAIVGSMWLVLSPAAASAQLAEGQRLLREADFAPAVRAFDRAEREEALTREDLILLYEGRAIARWATGDERRARRDLAALASLDPMHPFPAEAPPEVAAAFRENVAGGLEIALRFDDQPGRTTVHVDVGNDTAQIVRSARVRVRVRGGAWHEEESTSADLEVRPGDRVEACAEILGPGGAVLARAGSQLSPIAHPIPGAPASVELAVSDDGSAALGSSDLAASPGASGSDDSGVWIGVGVGIGLAAVAAAIVVGVLVATASSDRTQPVAPVVAF